MNHIPDHILLMEADGELEPVRSAEVRRHVATCAECRRKQTDLMSTLDGAIADQLAMELPPLDGALTHLRSRVRPNAAPRFVAVAAAAAAMALLTVQFWPETQGPVPRAALTPGVSRGLTRDAMCAVTSELERPAIPNAVAVEVFRKYGIHDPQPGTYEVDYLIPPDLGGTADEKNLWPQPYSEGKWNARVKDALEDRLRSLVCTGSLELSTAQNDIAVDWIGAYKKYFHTDAPLPDHVAFVKDRPWQ